MEREGPIYNAVCLPIVPVCLPLAPVCAFRLCLPLVVVLKTCKLILFLHLVIPSVVLIINLFWWRGKRREQPIYAVVCLPLVLVFAVSLV